MLYYALTNLIFKLPATHRDIHSFPTRRSSDLGGEEGDDGGDLGGCAGSLAHRHELGEGRRAGALRDLELGEDGRLDARSEEHTSELQSPCNLVCRLLLEKKNRNVINNCIKLSN